MRRNKAMWHTGALATAIAITLTLGACSKLPGASAAAPDAPAAKSADAKNPDAKPEAGKAADGPAKDDKNKTAAPAKVMEPAPIRAAKAKVQSVPIEMETFGAAEALSTVEVKALVSGQLTKVAFNEGDAVTKGQELFDIDPRPYEVALKGAEANVARADAQLAQAKADLVRDQAQSRNAQAEFARNKTLLDKGMVTKSEFDQSRATSDAMQASSDSDTAAIRSSAENKRAAEATVSQAKLDLEYCVIRSPIDGRTGSLMSHQGNIIKANDTSPMLTIAQTKPIYVTFTLPERYLSDLRARRAKGEVGVHAAPPGHEKDAAAGKLTFIDNTVDRQTSTIRLKATFANDAEQLWPGEYVNVMIELGTVENAVTVPAQAVQNSQRGTYVYVIGADNNAEMRIVHAGQTLHDLTVITDGLKGDETVVTEGQLRVAPGGPVKILTDTPAAEPAKP